MCIAYEAVFFHNDTFTPIHPTFYLTHRERVYRCVRHVNSGKKTPSLPYPARLDHQERASGHACHGGTVEITFTPPSPRGARLCDSVSESPLRQPSQQSRRAFSFSARLSGLQILGWRWIDGRDHAIVAFDRPGQEAPQPIQSKPLACQTPWAAPRNPEVQPLQPNPHIHNQQHQPHQHEAQGALGEVGRWSAPAPAPSRGSYSRCRSGGSICECAAHRPRPDRHKPARPRVAAPTGSVGRCARRSPGRSRTPPPHYGTCRSCDN